MLKHAMEECRECKDQFISIYFLVPKPNGFTRFIINLKKLNEFIEPIHFQLEDLRSAKNLLSSSA